MSHYDIFVSTLSKVLEMYIFRMILDYFLQNRMTGLIALVTMFIIPIKNVLVPHLYGKVIDNIGKKGFYMTFVIVIGVLVFTNIAMFLGNVHDAHIIPAIKTHVRRLMLERVLDKHELNHTEIETGDMISKLIKLPYIGSDWFYKLKQNVLPNILVFVFAVGYFTSQDIQIGMGLLLVVCVLILVLMWSPKVCRDNSLMLDKKHNEVHEHIEDTLRNLFSVYGAGQKEGEMKRIEMLGQEHRDLYVNTMKCGIKIEAFLMPLTISYMVFFVWKSSMLVKSGSMRKEKFVSMFIIMLYVLHGINRIVEHIRELVVDWGVMKSNEGLLFPTNHKENQRNIASATMPTTGISLNNVTFKYDGAHEPVFKNKTLHINQGDKVLIVGGIGSGKSTVLKLIMKYYLPDEGGVYIDGTNVMHIPTHELRRRVGYVPQQPVLFNRTMLENILYGIHDKDEQDVEAIMNKYGVWDDMGDMLYKNIGKNGSNISGGQRQVVWCLRVLLSEPDIILLDEPTASIDEKTRRIIYRMFIDDIGKDVTVVMVTHDAYMINRVDNIIHMTNGARDRPRDEWSRAYHVA